MPIQMFLKLDGIEGESIDARHKGEIDVLGWSWGLSEPASAQSGAGAGKVKIQDIVIQKQVDVASPLLMLASAEGKHIASGTLTTRRTGANSPEFLRFKMTDVLVASVAVSAAASESQPTESVVLGFAKVELDYSPTLPSGGLGPQKSFRWDIAANRPF